MNLQLDHFPMIKNTTTQKQPAWWWFPPLTQQQPQYNYLPLERGTAFSCCPRFEHGFHNVSRWMTWLPISLKNAAKCDKWYQLQNHSITESLNANGAREEPPTAIPVHAVSLSVEQKPIPQKESWLVAVSPQSWRPSGYPESTVKPSIHG